MANFFYRFEALLDQYRNQSSAADFYFHGRQKAHLIDSDFEFLGISCERSFASPIVLVPFNAHVEARFWGMIYVIAGGTSVYRFIGSIIGAFVGFIIGLFMVGIDPIASLPLILCGLAGLIYTGPRKKKKK